MAQLLIVDDDDGLQAGAGRSPALLGPRGRRGGRSRRRRRPRSRAATTTWCCSTLHLPDGSGIDFLDGAAAASDSAAPVVVLTAHGSIAGGGRGGARGRGRLPAETRGLRPAPRWSSTARSRRGARRGVNRALAGRRDPRPRRRVARDARSCSQLADPGRAREVDDPDHRGERHRQAARWRSSSTRRATARRRPFVYVNCVALPDELIEDTLFGHEKGAFTGALARKEGRLEAADGGTAFLDEIGDISPRMQTKLLHFLETGEFERVGGTRTLTDRLPDRRRDQPRSACAPVRDGRFREDLYFRLNVIGLRLPPLRERREEIPAMARTLRPATSRASSAAAGAPAHRSAHDADPRAPTPGRATSASSRTRSSAWSCSLRATS